MEFITPYIGPVSLLLFVCLFVHYVISYEDYMKISISVAVCLVEF